MPSFLNSQLAAEEAQQARIEELARVKAEKKTLELRCKALEGLLLRYGELIVTMEIELMEARLKNDTTGTG